MEVTQLKRSTTLQITKNQFPQLPRELFFPFPNSTTCRSGTLSFLNFFFVLPLSCYRQPFFHLSFLRSIFLRSSPAPFPAIGISTPLTDAIPHHCCRLHSYIRINDCTSIPVFSTLQHPNYHYSEYKQETCVGTFRSHFTSYVSNVPLRPHILT